MELDAYLDALAVVPNMRTATFDDLEMSRQKEGFRFTGHAGVYDEEALIDEIPGVGEIRETVRRPAFEPILATVERENVNVPFTIEHDETRVLATTRSKRLRLSADGKGLAVDAELPATSLSRDLYANYQAGIVTGMSYGFVTGPKSSGNWTIERRSSGALRVITGFKRLLDVTATWNPTFLSAEAQFRSQALRFAESPELLQQILRGASARRQDGAAAGELVEAEFRAVTLDDDATQIARLRAMLSVAADFIADEDEQTDIDRMTSVQDVLETLLQAELAETGDSGTESGATRSANERIPSIAARKRALSLYLIETGGIER